MNISEELNQNKIEDYLYNVQEILVDSDNNKIERNYNKYDIIKPVENDNNTNQMGPSSLISDSGDIVNNYLPLDRQSIDSLLKENQSVDKLIEPYSTSEDPLPINENETAMKFRHHLKTKYSFITEHPLSHVDSQHAIVIEQELGVLSNEEEQLQSLLHDNDIQTIENDDSEQQINLPEKTDWTDLNPYEPSIPPLLIHNRSQENDLNMKTTSEYSCENNQNIDSSLFMCYLSIFHYEHCMTSSCYLLPQSVQNYFESFQQLWSSQVYCTNLSDFNTSKSTLSIHWSFINVILKLIFMGLHLLYSCLNDTILFAFCYFLGALFGMNAYFFIDFLLMVICIISIFVSTYERWFFHYIQLNENDNMNNDSQYWRRIKLVAYGLSIGTMSAYFT